ncbi:MAG TPA: helix-turn-helix transcriptional regulator [Pseudonocardiaceae bacterium]|nr:helix-turn-helix transcriptional regulator [Pseudonocardiaceae bacterium]
MERSELTRREDEVLHLVLDGLSNDEIAARLAISRRTVETHLRTLFRKTGVSRRAQLAVLYQGGDVSAGPGAPDASDALAPPLSRHRRDLADCERKLQAYAAAVRGLVDRQVPLFEDRVEITLMVGEQDGQDIIIERHWTRPRPYLVYRILGPIMTWPDGPPFEFGDLALNCDVVGRDTRADVHPVQDVNGRPLLLILFQPGLHDETEWVLRYHSPGLWNPLRESGQDSLTWATSTLDQRHPATTRELTLRVVFPASWSGEQLTEQSNLGVIHTERLPTSQTQLTWHHDTEHTGAYHWVLQGSPG